MDAISKRDQAVAAAIELVATEGLRALTHRRVDQRASLPPGSTSNYFRTRAALYQGVVDRMVSRELPLVDDESRALTPDALAGALTDLFEFLIGPGRDQTAARMAMFVESAHDQDLRSALAAGRDRFELVLRQQLASAGAADPDLGVQLIAVCFEGMFLHRLGGYADVDAARVIRAIVQTAMASDTPP